LQATQTAQSCIQAVSQPNYPFKWDSKDAGLTVSILPEIASYYAFFEIYIHVANNSGQVCKYETQQIYALDDLNQRYEQSYSGGIYFSEITSGHYEYDSEYLKPALSVNVKSLTVFIDKLCGYKDIKVSIDLQSALLHIKK